MLKMLEDMLDHEPFQPFRIVITSGHVYEIDNPHLVALGQTEITIYVARSDRFIRVPLFQIATIEAM